MWTHVFAIIGLMALCGAWVLFQLWLKRAEPDGRDADQHCRGCGNCSRRTGVG